MPLFGMLLNLWNKPATKEHILMDECDATSLIYILYIINMLEFLSKKNSLTVLARINFSLNVSVKLCVWSTCCLTNDNHQFEIKPIHKTFIRN